MPEIKLLKPFVMCVMENPASRCGISRLSQMGENTGPAASNSAGESPHSAGFRSFGSGMYLTLRVAKLSRNILEDNFVRNATFLLISDVYVSYSNQASKENSVTLGKL